MTEVYYDYCVCVVDVCFGVAKVEVTVDVGKEGDMLANVTCTE